MSSLVTNHLVRACSVLAALLAGTAGIGAAASTASADTTAIVFSGINEIPSGGQMNVQLLSPTPINSMTIHLYSGSDDVLDLPLSDFTDESAFSADEDQSYELTDPATALGSLPLGTYTATGDATDTGGDSVTAQAISGSFAFLAGTTITIGPASVYTTYPDEPVTISGQLSIQDPFASSPSGFARQTVTITEYGTSPATYTTTTASDGTYTLQVPGTPLDLYEASFGATATSRAANPSGVVEDYGQAATTQLTATVSPATADYGHTQSIGGTLTYQSGSQWLPAPAGVTVTFAQEGGSKNVTATTQAGGTFSATLPTVPGTTTWLVNSEQDNNSNPFLQSAETQVNGTVLLPAAITRFTAKLSKYGVVTVTGCLATTAAGQSVSDHPNVEIQYTIDPGGPWRKLGSVGTGNMNGCAGAAIDAGGQAPSNYAYYRATFTGDSVLEPATSNASLAWLYATRFSPFKVSPRSVTSGKKFTVSGTLQYFYSHWRGYGHQRVRIIFSPNKKTWYSYGWVTTSSKGTFSKSIADRYGTGYWTVLYYGNNTHLVAGTTIIKVTVRRAHASANSLGSGVAAGLGPLVSLPRRGDGSHPLQSVLGPARPAMVVSPWALVFTSR
jgi:hypothetical protein